MQAGVSVVIGTFGASSGSSGPLPRAWPMARSRTTFPLAAHAELQAWVDAASVEVHRPVPDVLDRLPVEPASAASTSSPPRRRRLQIVWQANPTEDVRDAWQPRQVENVREVWTSRCHGGYSRLSSSALLPGGDDLIRERLRGLLRVHLRELLAQAADLLQLVGVAQLVLARGATCRPPPARARCPSRPSLRRGGAAGSRSSQAPRGPPRPVVRVEHRRDHRQRSAALLTQARGPRRRSA